MKCAVTADNPAEALKREWLLTNGLGGFAMGTALGANTRRYHGLLIAALRPPVGRIVALHSVIEELVIAGKPFELATHQFGAAAELHPDGWRRVKEFCPKPPTEARWVYRLGGITIEKSIALKPGANQVSVNYRIEGAAEGALFRVRPLTPMRDFHSLECESGQGRSVTIVDEAVMSLRRGDLGLEMIQRGGRWTVDEQWWHNFAYIEERDRGQDWTEDVWAPGYVEAEVPAGGSMELDVVVAVPEVAPVAIDLPVAADGSAPAGRLRAAAGQFITRRKLKGEWASTILAGYPWFADWGRDTMIALPGLMLCTERFEEAKSVLLSYGQRVLRGLLPNVFSDYDEGAAYNTVDASLWFVHVVREYIQASQDGNVDELLDTCRSILFAYRNGTDFDIHLDEDGLITAGDANSQLTWMDAKREGIVFTPRYGKPVEINALWHNALMSLAELTADDRERGELRSSAARTAQAIQEHFWWEQRGCLHDVLLPREGGWYPDGKLRSNQIFAVSLPFSPLTADQRRSVVEVVRDRLLTPFGLRTLDPADEAYRGRYEGDLMQRDAAYHNGTVWPWLIGPYCEAVLRVGDFSEASVIEVSGAIEPLLAELDRGCVNQIAEVYDGSEPQRPSGCPAQAWSVAELLRVFLLTQRVSVA